jgi:hypothetical protein
MEDSKTSWAIEFPENLTILGNMALALWIALDTAAFLLHDLVLGVVFVLVALIAVYGVLKFLGCLRPCYNCRKCTFGMGRLAALYFGKRSLKDYEYNYKLPTAVFFYVLIGLFPAVFALVSFVQDFTLVKGAVFVSLVVLTVYSGLTWRKTKTAST